MSGIYLVTTPIGNIRDMTARAIEIIGLADHIYCEDTRVFKNLARHLNINLQDKSITSYHDHSSEQKLKGIVERARSKKVVFLSDAGSPIIADPAFPLVQMALKYEVPLHSISGISAITCALELSGLPPIPFHFHGFLARDKSKKHKDYDLLGESYGTHIFFEGVSRVIKTLSELTEKYPNLDFVVARELTKEFESVYRFKGEKFTQVKDDIIEKGEFVILVHNPTKQNPLEGGNIQKLAADVMADGGRPKTLAKLLSAITGEANKDVYKRLVDSK